MFCNNAFVGAKSVIKTRFGCNIQRHLAKDASNSNHMDLHRNHNWMGYQKTGNNNSPVLFAISHEIAILAQAVFACERGNIHMQIMTP